MTAPAPGRMKRIGPVRSLPTPLAGVFFGGVLAKRRSSPHEDTVQVMVVLNEGELLVDDLGPVARTYSVREVLLTGLQPKAASHWGLRPSWVTLAGAFESMARMLNWLSSGAVPGAPLVHVPEAGMASIAGLPVNSAMVLVAPPLSCSGPRVDASDAFDGIEPQDASLLRL